MSSFTTNTNNRDDEMEVVGDEVPEEVEIPTLQTLCVEYIKTHTLRTLEDCLSLYGRVAGMQSCSIAPLRPILMNKIRSWFPVLQVKVPNTKDLQDFFLPEDWMMLEQEYREREEAKRVMGYYKGTVVERAAVKVVSEDQASYPLEALVQGVAWPRNVDPTNRELFLSDDDFYKVFHMTKEAFRNEAKYVRMRLKKEHGLF